MAQKNTEEGHRTGSEVLSSCECLASSCCWPWWREGRSRWTHVIGSAFFKDPPSAAIGFTGLLFTSMTGWRKRLRPMSSTWCLFSIFCSSFVDVLTHKPDSDMKRGKQSPGIREFEMTYTNVRGHPWTGMLEHAVSCFLSLPILPHRGAIVTLTFSFSSLNCTHIRQWKWENMRERQCLNACENECAVTFACLCVFLPW